MASPRAGVHKTAADTTEAVSAFLHALEHASKDLIQTIRSAITGADPSIAEGIKWNSPSFRTTEYFATLNLREKRGVGVILHLGAKVRDVPGDQLKLSDPEALLKWLAKDRAVVVFKDMADFLARRAAFENLIQQWIVQV